MARHLAIVAALLAVSAAMASAALLYPARLVPEDWTLASNTNVDTSKTLAIMIGLKRNNVALMDQYFWAVSDPAKTETYGRHIRDHEEMRRLVGASPQSVAAVKSWLQSAGVPAARLEKSFELSVHHDWVQVELALSEIETLLSVKFQNYVHKSSGKVLPRATQSVHIPEGLVGIVETISGYGGFPSVSKYTEEGKLIAAKRVRPVKVGSPQTNVTPQVLYQAYNQTFFPPTPSGQRNIQSFFQAQGQQVNGTDLTTFCETFFQHNCSISKYIGDNQNNAGIESSLDSEYIMSTGNNAETWVFTYNNFDFCGDLMRWAKDVFVLAAQNVYPHVISMSYGSQSLPNYCLGPDVKRLSEDTQKMGLMGITVVIASGDDGSGESNRQTGFNYGYLSPSMPASMPYVIAVGSTTFVTGNSGQQEATTVFGSGGGFSSDYGQLAHQAPAAAQYFKTQTQLPNWIFYNATGRGTPDVSGLGEGYNIISAGAWMQVDGTSCSTPMFAGMVTMLNNIRLANGKTLGWIGPLIYGKGVGGFTDITMGNNDVAGDTQGWYATTGWDPATGLGTPNFGALANIVKNLNERDDHHQSKFHGKSILHGTKFAHHGRH